MKTYLLSIIIVLLSGAYSFAQTATNFTAKDCAGVSHDLFSELNAGKVIVLNWVMPCGACVPASLTTFTVVNGYQESNPNTVLYYLVDDLANTNCASLLSWAKGVPLSPVSSFSEASINMLDYGTQSMPKVVVLGGANHHVFMVADAVVEPVDLQAAINAALITADISEEVKDASWVQLNPNPACDHATLTINSAKINHLKAELFSIQGRKIETIYECNTLPGVSQKRINLAQYDSGVYIIRVSDAERNSTIKLTVSH